MRDSVADLEAYPDEYVEYLADLKRDDVSRWEMLLEIEPSTERFYIHKHEIAQAYGGPEEGGWWYQVGEPDEDWIPAHHGFDSEDEASAVCRGLNLQEAERADREEDYSYTSVLSYKSHHYSYSVEDHPTPFYYPEHRPHYE